jgi:hypothetical protein
LTLPRKAQEQQLAAWGEKQYDKVDKPLEELAKMKLHDWPFFAVFQKGLFRATATYLKGLGIGEKPGSLQEDLTKALAEWIDFLNEMCERGVFVVRAPLDSGAAGDLIWTGVALNPGSKTVRWTEATVDRIASLLILWWHFHDSGFRRVSNFMKRVGSKKSAERFPNGKGALDQVQRAIGQALKQMGVGDELDAGERDKLIAKGRDSRIETLINLALSKEPGTENEDDDGDDDDDVDADDATSAVGGAETEGESSEVDKA